MLFHLQNRVSVFGNFKFWPRYLVKRWLCPWNQHKELWWKPFITWVKQTKQIWDTDLQTKTAEKDNVKINVSANIPCTFLLFKASAFLQKNFPRKSKFWERQLFTRINVSHSFTYWPIYVFNWTKEHRLKTSNKRTHFFTHFLF